MAQLKITYVKSSIGYAQNQKDTVKSLGLRKLNQSVVHEDTPVIRGMVFKVQHLVKVEEIEGTMSDSAQPVPTTSASTVRRTSGGEE